jgi:thymidylate synthase ThyX
MSTISSINHTRKSLSGGGQVVVLNTGAVINPESEAMLQALHSRSTEGIDGHLKVLNEKGSEKFMSSYYVGYGHKSIGDCGSATLFIEGVSMLAAKAIQDWKLYSGQESSTRYIDFANQTFLNPAGNDAGTQIQEAWRIFYLKAVEEMKVVLKERYPISEGEKETVYDKAIAARAFDTTRGFLPAGATTNLAWHGNLRQFADKLALLRHHPLAEVREIAQTTESALLESFPNSFTDKRYDATETYNAEIMKSYYYHVADAPVCTLTHNGVDKTELGKMKGLLASRPAKTELPKWVGVTGEVGFSYKLDFGSFRDIQRHRAITQRMPLLTIELGFNDWYLEELSDTLRAEATNLLANQAGAIAKLNLSPEETQYYVAMGYNTSNYFTGDIPAIVYMVELRATRFVHPTLRHQAAKMAELLESEFKNEGLVIHLDPEMDRFDSKRGEHDIQKKD